MNLTTTSISETKPAAANPPAGLLGVGPVVLALPFALTKLWAVYITVLGLGALAATARQWGLTRRAPTMSLVTLGFALVNAVCYFGFDTTVVLRHLDAGIYTLILAQVALSLRWGPYWTEQFSARAAARRGIETNQAFHDANRFVTRIWVALLIVCDLVALLTHDHRVRTWLPILLLVLMIVQMPRLMRRHLTRTTGASAPPPRPR